MPTAEEDQATALRALDDMFGAERAIDEQRIEATMEVIRAEIAEDVVTAARHGRKMNTKTMNIRGLAVEAIKRQMGLRTVKGWMHPLPPLGWKLDEVGNHTVAYKHRALSLAALLSCEIEDDGRAYVHLSVSHKTRIPTWSELGKAKEDFLGDLEAYQVLPPRSRYVNIDARVLNLYAPLAGPLLPDFTRGTGGI